VTGRYHGDPRPDIQALVAPAGLRCLDVGCGEGALGAALKHAGATYVAGIELDERAAAVARERLDALVVGAVLDVPLPFDEAAFHLLVFADVLEHLPDPDAVLERCLPLLAPGGTVVISVPNMRFWLVLLRLIADRWEYADSGVRDRTHLRVFTRRSLEQMIARHGLEVAHLERRFRLLDDQSRIGRIGALATRLARPTLGRVFRDLMAYQYVVIARRP
jgi:2-polyprenyl-3-methyl-5-hydroxy-6-metoxy-1,4-benzoquinol methylase